MKTLTQPELIALLPTDEKVDAALKRFDIAAPVLCREPGYVKELVSEGWTTVEQVNFEGRPAFILSWRMTSDKGFWVDIAQTLDSRAPMDVLFAAGEQLARQKGARYIRFATLRRGMVRQAAMHGFTAEAVLLVKPL